MKISNKFSIGEMVGVINETLIGKIVHITSSQITIECQDGFNYHYDQAELVSKKDWNGMIIAHQKPADQHDSRLEKAVIKGKSKETILELDLHIHELVKSERGLSSHDKLNIQLSAAKDKLENAIRKKDKKIIFIHGRGEGVLKQHLLKLLDAYPVEYLDASYSNYGMGATEVRIYQNKK